MKRLLLLLCIVLSCLLVITACDKDDGSGGGQADKSLTGSAPENAGDRTVPTATFTGPDSTISYSTTFECQTKNMGVAIMARQWRVSGVGTIAGASNQKYVKITASGSGTFTVKLRVLSPEKVWSRWVEKTVTVTFPGFVITPGPLFGGNIMIWWPARGSNATLLMTDAFSAYNNYSITFEGDTSALPSQVPVTITWAMQNAPWFRWAAPYTESGTHTFNLPVGGGSIGLSGTAVNLDSPRPVIGFAVSGKTAGTVTYQAPGVNPLTITVVRP